MSFVLKVQTMLNEKHWLLCAGSADFEEYPPSAWPAGFLCPCFLCICGVLWHVTRVEFLLSVVGCCVLVVVFGMCSLLAAAFQLRTAFMLYTWGVFPFAFLFGMFLSLYMFVWSACLRFATASCGLAPVALQKFLGKRGVSWCPLPQSLHGQRHREDVRLARILLLQDPSLQCMGCLPGRDTWSLLRKKHKQKHIYY